MESMKEKVIRDYISTIDFNRDDWKISKINEDLHILLNETPGIDIQYKKDAMLLEGESEAREIEIVSKISIVFMDTDDKFKKIELGVEPIY